MTVQKKPKTSLYPGAHLIAAGGLAALLTSALMAFPSSKEQGNAPAGDLDAPQALSQDAAEHLLLEGHQEPSTATPAFSVAKADAPVLNAEETAIPLAKPARIELTANHKDSLSSLFAKAGLPVHNAKEVLASSKHVKGLSKPHAGQNFVFVIAEDGLLAELSTWPSLLEALHVRRNAGKYAVSREIIQPRTQERYERIVINGSLSSAARSAGVPRSMIAKLTDIYRNRINIDKDLRPGDELELLYEEKIANDTRVGVGHILAARLVSRGKSHTAIRYQNKQGAVSYYASNGNNLSRGAAMFLPTPAAAAHISSGFSGGRKHPILNRVRPHKGVDFAAAVGTPIRATADGKVFLAGRKGGYGNAIILQHGERYRTLYGHMKSFARDIRPGVTVKQGQLIGYIGNTGLSTGPHVHYELHIDNTPVNPLTQKITQNTAVPASERQRFLQLSRPLIARMNQQKATALAMNTSYYQR